jgi:hypothetical protein
MNFSLGWREYKQIKFYFFKETLFLNGFVVPRQTMRGKLNFLTKLRIGEMKNKKKTKYEPPKFRTVFFWKKDKQ